jgi:hypothetical protein
MVEVAVHGVGVLGPGFDGWSQARAVLRGESPYAFAPTRNPAPAIMPAAERRRASAAIRIALEVAHQAVTHAGLDAAELPAVFSSCDGDGDTIHAVCLAIAQPDYPVSPTKFTNSVHNAPAGYWSIALGARAASISLCAWEGSVAAGLLEAAALVAADGVPVLVAATDTPLPAPLHALHPHEAAFGAALVLAPAGQPGALANLRIEPTAAIATTWPSQLPERAAVNPAAQALSVLALVAADGPGRAVLPYVPGLALAVERAS